MRIVLTAPLTIFVNLQFFLDLPLVARGVIIDPPAIGAFEFDEIVL